MGEDEADSRSDTLAGNRGAGRYAAFMGDKEMIQHASWLWQGHSGMVESYLPEGIAVICLEPNDMRRFPPAKKGHNYLWCPFDDSGDSLTGAHLVSIVSFAAAFAEKGAIFVHCAAGKNRSSAVCALLLHKLSGLSPEDACAHVFKNNPEMTITRELTRKLSQLTGGLEFRNPETPEEVEAQNRDFAAVSYERVERGNLQEGRFYLIVEHAVEGRRGSSYQCMKANGKDTFLDNDGDHTCRWPSDKNTDVYFLP
jgi:protein-tyrosine phosphatase